MRTSPLLLRAFSCRRVFSSREPSLRKRFLDLNEKFFAIASMVITIPMAVYLYKKKKLKEEVDSHKGLLINATAESERRTENKKTPENSSPLEESNEIASTGINEIAKEEFSASNEQSNISTSTSQKESQDLLTANSALSAKYLLIGGGTASYAAMQAILEVEPDANVNRTLTIPINHCRF